MLAVFTSRLRLLSILKKLLNWNLQGRRQRDRFIRVHLPFAPDNVGKYGFWNPGPVSNIALLLSCFLDNSSDVFIDYIFFHLICV